MRCANRLAKFISTHVLSKRFVLEILMRGSAKPTVQVMARLPESQKRWLDEQATKNETSQSREISRLIEEAREREPAS